MINSSATFDYDEMLKFVKGVISSGIWVLFDEFNRIELHMMRYITQLISQITHSFRANQKFITVDTNRVMLDDNTAVFITMNPGYEGRVELPQNLRNLFRPVSMVVPDFQLISEILLSRGGFYQANALSKKMTHIQKHANELILK